MGRYNEVNKYWNSVDKGNMLLKDKVDIINKICDLKGKYTFKYENKSID